MWKTKLLVLGAAFVLVAPVFIFVPTAAAQTVQTPPDETVTIKGRFVDALTSGFGVSGVAIYHGGAVVATTGPNGEFSFTVGKNAALAQPQSFFFWPNCYIQGVIDVLKSTDGGLIAKMGIFGSRVDKSVSIVSNAADLDTLSLWPAVDLNLSSDVPVPLTIWYNTALGDGGGVGNVLYKTSHVLSNVIPLNYEGIRVVLSENADSQYTAPANIFPSVPRCNAAKLTFANKQFTWGEKTAPSVTVTAPNGGEQAVSGQPYTIRWSSAQVTTNVAIQVLDAVTNQSLFGATAIPNTGSYTWTPSGGAVTAAKVRISAHDDTVSDTSDKTFSILPPPGGGGGGAGGGTYLLVRSPNGGEVWEVNKTYPITWETLGVASAVQIDLYQRVSGNWIQIAYVGNTGRYDWTIPESFGRLSEQYQIRVRGFPVGSTTEVSDVSDNPFTITTGGAPVVTALKPGLLPRGQTTEVVITGSNLSRQGEFSGCGITPVNEGGFQLISCRVISDSEMSATFSASGDAALGTRNIMIVTRDTKSNPVSLTIVEKAPAVTVLNPNGREILSIGQEVKISWTRNWMPQKANGLVNIYYRRTTGSNQLNQLIASSVKDAAGFNWVVPTSLVPGDDYKITITSHGFGGSVESPLSDESDAFFSIAAPSTQSMITVTLPNGGETWSIGSTQKIRWQGSAESIYVFKANQAVGAPVYTVVSHPGTPDTSGELEWTIPKHEYFTPDRYVVQIVGCCSTVRPDVPTDNSDAAFSIVAASAPVVGSAVIVLSPNGGEKWIAGQQVTITWRRNWMPDQANGLVDIYYKRGNGLGTLLAGGAADASGFTWIVSSWLAPADDYKIVVVSRGFGGTSSQPLSDESDAPFSVAASPTASSLVRVLSPNGGQVWAQGETRQVQWCAQEQLGEGISSIWLSRKSGLPISEHTSAVRLEQAKGILLCGSGATTFPWYIPSDMPAADDYQIEVRFERTEGVAIAKDASDAAFRIVPSGTLSDPPTTPELFLTYKSGRTVTINGVVYGAMRAEGMHWLWGDGTEGDSYFPASHTYAQDGRYTVTVVASNAAGKTQASIEVTAIGGASPPEPPRPTFEPPFSGVPLAIGVTSPRGGEVWQKGGSYAINWIQQGVKYINLSLFKDGNFVQYIARDLPVHKNLPQTGMQWVVPFNLISGGGYQIYVVAPIEGAMTSASNAFSIAGAEPTAACLPEGTLIKMPDDSKVYVIEQCQKRWIQNAEEFQSKGYQWDQVKPVEPTVAEAYTEYLQAQAKLLKAIGDSRVYEVVNGKRLWIPTAQSFQEQGFKWEEVSQASAGEVNNYPRARLLKAAGDNRIYYVTESGLKRHMVNPETFLSYGNKWEDVLEVSPSKLGLYADNALIKRLGDAKVYKLESGKKRWVSSLEAFERHQFNWEQVAPINETEFNVYQEEAPLG